MPAGIRVVATDLFALPPDSLLPAAGHKTASTFDRPALPERAPDAVRCACAVLQIDPDGKILVREIQT